MNSFLESYIETALWSSTDDNGDSLDASYYVSDIVPETLAQMKKDCDNFREQAEDYLDPLDVSLEKIAHDFWLTRNRHGAGFWDGDYPEPIGKALTDIAHSFGSFDLILGEDGKIHGY